MATSIPVAGIDSYFAKEIIFKLRHDKILAALCEDTLELLQKCVDLINREMMVIYNEIAYWRTVSEATMAEKKLINLFHHGPLHFLSTIRKYLCETLTEDEDSLVDLRLSILRDAFTVLAELLGNLHDSGSEIRSVSLLYDKLSISAPDVNFASSDESVDRSDLPSDQLQTLSKQTHDKVYCCLARVIKCLSILNDSHLNDRDSNLQNSRSGSGITEMVEMSEAAKRLMTEVEVPPKFVESIALIFFHIIDRAACCYPGSVCSSAKSFPALLALVSAHNGDRTIRNQLCCTIHNGWNISANFSSSSNCDADEYRGACPRSPR
jgi:hypothetical protein